MGDPKKHRKKYATPAHPWRRERIEEEKKFMKEYGFRNKTEIWKVSEFLRNATAQAKKLITLSGPQADKEKKLLLDRLRKYGLLSSEAEVDTILSLSVRDVMGRRLQTLVYKKSLANSVKQARQFITHCHICINGKVITSPAYLVSVSEESQISFRENSGLSDSEHPERTSALTGQERTAKKNARDAAKAEQENKFRRGGPNKPGQRRQSPPKGNQKR
ncbi:MAG: 30S ribosomal protein S4 [Candidatus Woesearchaeota archaeon]